MRADLADTLLSVPHHLFGNPETCGLWCQAHKTGTQKVVLQNQSLYEAMKEIFVKYASNAPKFCIAVSSQPNESLNLMSRKAPESQQSESADYRDASSVCVKNEENVYLLRVLELLKIPANQELVTFLHNQNNIRYRKTTVAQTCEQKFRRRMLSTKREDLRKREEIQEGIQYQSKCGWEMDFETWSKSQQRADALSDTPESVDPQLEESIVGDISISEDTFAIVFFDVETSGLGRKAEILQLPARTGETQFSCYITPTAPIHPKATKVHKLENRGGVLYHEGKEVTATLPLVELLLQFRVFLQSFHMSSYLVAHNVQFDKMFLLKAMKKTSAVKFFSPFTVFF